MQEKGAAWEEEGEVEGDWVLGSGVRQRETGIRRGEVEGASGGAREKGRRRRRGSIGMGSRLGLGLPGQGWALEASPKERRSQLGLLDWALPLLSLFFK